MSRAAEDVGSLADSTDYLRRLLTHAGSHPEAAGNTLFQMALMLARLSLDVTDPALERDLTGSLFDALRRCQPAPADNVVPLARFRRAGA